MTSGFGLSKVCQKIFFLSEKFRQAMQNLGLKNPNLGKNLEAKLKM